MKIYDLRTEYRKKPVGLDTLVPRFSWKMRTDEKNTVQNLYRIEVSTGEQSVWDTGIRESSESVLVPYEGEPLKDEALYQVKVTVWDNYGRADSVAASFETGVFDPSDFQAQMITHDFPKEETACPVFYKKVTLKENVKKARLYATAEGVYEFEINGVKAGKDRMTPGWTSYHNRLQYQVYDVTELLKNGENLLEMTVGNGWHKGILGFLCTPDVYGDRVGAFAELHIVYGDGRCETIITDESWCVRTGEIRYSEIYMGETIQRSKKELSLSRNLTNTSSPLRKMNRYVSQSASRQRE